MSIATDKLESIRQQVQYHLDHAEQKRLTPEQQADLKEQIKARLEEENAVIVAHYYTAPEIQALANPAMKLENLPFDPLEYVEHLDELPFDPNSDPGLGDSQ